MQPLKLGDLTITAEATESFGSDLISQCVSAHHDGFWGKLNPVDEDLQNQIFEADEIPADGQIFRSKWEHPAKPLEVIWIVTRYNKHTTVILAP